jgi:hypothetical protein
MEYKSSAVGPAQAQQLPQQTPTRNAGDVLLTVFQAALVGCWIGGAIWLSRESKLAPKLMLGIALPLSVVSCLRCGAGLRASQQTAGRNQRAVEVTGFTNLILSFAENAALIRDAATLISDAAQQRERILLADDYDAHVVSLLRARDAYVQSGGRGQNFLAIVNGQLRQDWLALDGRQNQFWPGGVQPKRNAELVKAEGRQKYAERIQVQGAAAPAVGGAGARVSPEQQAAVRQQRTAETVELNKTIIEVGVKAVHLRRLAGSVERPATRADYNTLADDYDHEAAKMLERQTAYVRDGGRGKSFAEIVSTEVMPPVQALDLRRAQLCPGATMLLLEEHAFEGEVRQKFGLPA